jgi:hypothetical protein
MSTIQQREQLRFDDELEDTKEVIRIRKFKKDI